jgi:hypothetical protein
MVLKPKDLEYKFKERNKTIEECEAEIAAGKLHPADAEQLCDIERFAPYPFDIGDNCFVCGEKLTLPAIVWCGCHQDNSTPLNIGIHPNCAPQLFLGLKDDWHEWDLTLNPNGTTYDQSKPNPFDGKPTTKR